MKILIVDDAQKNLKAAKLAANGFPEIEFEFLSSASQALKKIEGADRIITDLFFPPEEDEELTKEYSFFVDRISKSPKLEEVVEKYYSLRTDLDMEKSFQNTLKLMREGTQFLYGGVLMLRAKAQGKHHVLITNLHKHATYCTDLANSIDGMIVLLPLIEESIISVEQAMSDGRGSLTYVGEDELLFGGGGSKESPRAWEKALIKLLNQ